MGASGGGGGGGGGGDGGGGGGSDPGIKREEDQFNNPSFIFLQLYNNRCLGEDLDPPILLPPDEI